MVMFHSYVELSEGINICLCTANLMFTLYIHGIHRMTLVILIVVIIPNGTKKNIKALLRKHHAGCWLMILLIP